MGKQEEEEKGFAILEEIGNYLNWEARQRARNIVRKRLDEQREIADAWASYEEGYNENADGGGYEEYYQV